jgi:hypothetical protein
MLTNRLNVFMMNLSPVNQADRRGEQHGHERVRRMF